MLQFNGQKSGCELKITAASAGSLVLKYDGKNKRNPWSFGKVSEDDAEKMFIKELGEEIGIFDLIKKKWKDVPLKREKDDLLPLQTTIYLIHLVRNFIQKSKYFLPSYPFGKV